MTGSPLVTLKMEDAGIFFFYMHPSSSPLLPRPEAKALRALIVCDRRIESGSMAPHFVTDSLGPSARSLYA
uniref:Uncharacterized protein n=1 Tax=Ascaris lumbricoides TaxID=6252 RepID=A0A0M3I5Y7_ASCLU